MVDMNELQRAWEAADAQEKNNQEIISNYIKSLTTEKIIVRSSIRRNDFGIEVEFLDDNDKRIFGADFSIYYRAEWRKEEPVLKMNSGTIGSYSRQEAPAQIARLELMLNIWKHEDELVKLLTGLDFSAIDYAAELQREKNREEREIEQKEREEKITKIKADLVVGKTFTIAKEEGSAEYTITKITPKRVYIDYTLKWPTERYDRATKQFVKTIEVRHASAYIDKETYISVLSGKWANGILSSAQGVVYRSFSYEDIAA